MEVPIEWIKLYRAALLEIDYAKLPERLRLTDQAIRARSQMLPPGADGNEERHAMQDALRNLDVLRRELAQSRDPFGSPHQHPEIHGEYVVFVDNNRRYVEVTDGVCRLLGYSRSELFCKTIDDISAPELRSNVAEVFEQYVNKGGLEGSFTLLAKDGRRVPIRYESKVFPDGCLVARWQPL